MLDNTGSKSVIRINGEMHNLKALLDLLKSHQVKVNRVIAINPEESALEEITDSFIPSMITQLILDASYGEVHRVLEDSYEFNKYANNILGTV